MATIKGFVSYSSDDRVIAGKVKDELSVYGIACFLAHEDLEPSVEWQREITTHLQQCELFLPLISVHFRASKWTDQEVGMAVAWQKKITPLGLAGVVPHGFIGIYQSTRLDVENLSDSIARLVVKLAEDPTLGPTIIDELIASFGNSLSFEQAGQRSRVLFGLDTRLTADQRECIVRLSSANNQIFLSNGARTVLAQMIGRHPELDPASVNRLRRAMGEIELE